MKKMLLIGGIVLLAGLAGTFGFLYFTQEPPEPAMAEALPPEPPETFYYPITPEFIVNFRQQSGSQFLMVDVTVASLDAKVPEILATHMAELRNDLLILFGSHANEELYTNDGRAALRSQAVESLNAFVQKHYPEGEISDLFFTRFVMQ